MRLIYLGLHRKPIKLQDKKFVLFTEATGALPVSRGSEDAEHLPIHVLETQADKWTQGAPMLQGISLRKRERERERKKKKKKHGVTKLLRWARPKSFIFQKVLLYLALYIEGNEGCKVIQSQPKHFSSFALIKTRIFLHTFPTNDVVYSIFWPWRPVNILWPSFDKGCSTRKLIFPQSVFSLCF